VESQVGGIRFCTECGKAIPYGSDFCYACGALAPASPTVIAVVNDAKAAGQETPSNSSTQTNSPNSLPPTEFILQTYKLTLSKIARSVSNMTMVWGIISILMGTMSIITAPTLAQVYNDFYATSIDVNSILLEGMHLEISGVAALAGSYLLRKLRMLNVCIGCLVVSAVASYPGVGGFLGVITCLVGCYMALAAYRCRRAFH